MHTLFRHSCVAARCAAEYATASETVLCVAAQWCKASKDCHNLHTGGVGRVGAGDDRQCRRGSSAVCDPVGWQQHVGTDAAQLLSHAPGNVVMLPSTALLPALQHGPQQLPRCAGAAQSSDTTSPHGEQRQQQQQWHWHLQQLPQCWQSDTSVLAGQHMRASALWRWQQQQQQQQFLLRPQSMQHTWQGLQQYRHFHQQQQQQRPQQPSSQQGGKPGSVGTAQAGTGEKLPGAAFTTLPNILSLSRVAMGPWLAYSIACQQWPFAVALTAAAGVTDWLDGYLARRLGHTSKLGSYLDPLADKIFVATAVGTMGVMGMIPYWLAVLVVGRDSTQVVGMFWYRLRMFGGVWPGASAFFDVDHAVGSIVTSSSTASNAQGSNAAAGSTNGKQQQQLPTIRPLMISKANTALIMALVAGCMANQWQGLPDQDVLAALEMVTAGTTLASAVAYGHLHWKGKLLASPPAQGGNS